MFDSLDSKRIKSADLRTSGAAGPSGLDALAWRRLCTSHKTASNELCNALALVAKCLCTTHIDPQSIAPLTACRLIALDKNPGVRPIGIGDTTWRVIAKATLSVIRVDVQEAAGSMQRCAGHISGTEAAVHAVRALYESDETEAILLIEASNAFNSLNRQTALHNIQRRCPALATILINMYRAPNELYIDGDVILSQEGTTQGDSLAMSMYAVATFLLFKNEMNDVDQDWYADDASVAGRIMRLREWWEKLTIQGPKYGYFPNAIKTWLVSKQKHHSEATAVFNDTEVKVTSEGRPYLGTALGTTHSYVSSMVQEWSTELLALNNISKTQPHAAYAAFTHCLSSKWSYLSRTTPDIGTLLQPLEHIIHTKLSLSLTNRPPPNATERDLLALPARLGGIALTDPTKSANLEFSASTKITEPLKNAILQQNFEYILS